MSRSGVHFQVTAINGKLSYNAFIIDISPFGAKFEATEIPSCELLEIKFLIPGQRQETRVFGEIVWIDEHGAPLGCYHVGISFLQPYWKFCYFC